MDVNASITSSGGGAINLDADNTGTGTGTINFGSGALASTSGAVSILYNPAGNDPRSVNPTSYTTLTNYAADVAGGAQLTAYMLVNTVYDLQNIQNNLSGDYSLGRDIDAGLTAGWNTGFGFVPIGTQSQPFTGELEGQGHVIAGLTIDRPSDTFDAMFRSTRNADFHDFGLIDAYVVGGRFVAALVANSITSLISDVYSTGSIQVSGYGDIAGGLIAASDTDKITASWSSASVTATDEAGGLVGDTEKSSVSSSYASGVIRTSGGDAGGLVGDNGGSIFNSYALGSATGSAYVGGLVGRNSAEGGLQGAVSTSYATGKVSGTGSGGLVGWNDGGTIQNSYWDAKTTGQSAAVGYGLDSGVIAGLTPVGTSTSAYAQASYASLDFTASGPWVILDGSTRPLLRSEYSTTVTNAHQLQLMALNLSATYTLGADIDASGTSDPSDVWGLTGFSPLATKTTPFTGVLDGRGHVVTGLYEDLPGADGLGLFTYSAGIIEDLRLANVSITGSGDTGALVGFSSGSINQVTVTGAVNGDSNDVGGLVGYLSGAMTNVSFSGTVSNPGRVVTGGVVGWNDGTVENASSYGIVTSGVYVGGVIGYNQVGVSASNLNSDATVVAGQDSGGIVGWNRGSISDAYFTGVVGEGGAKTVGGIAGLSSDGTISRAYSSGSVLGSGGALVGSGTIANAYWDTVTSGQTVAVGSLSAPTSNVLGINGSTGLSPYAQSTYAGFDFSSSGPWVVFEGSTRPLLRSEYSTIVTNAHQLQLTALDLSATYTLAANVDASGTANPSDVWSPAGFVPVGHASSPFTGVLNGAGHTVSGLTIDAPASTGVGLFGYLSGAAEAVTVSGAITGGTDVGALVGYNAGTVSGASGKGTVSGSSQVGGLVGYSSGAISGSSGKAAVSSPQNAGTQMGGLAGFNSGQLNADYATGKVSGNTEVGGLVGLNSGSGVLTGDYATGVVNGASGKTATGSGSAIGGLVGESMGDILSSHATGAVTGYSQVGGLAGYTLDDTQVISSYATGAVSGVSGQNTPAGSGALVGGLIGESAEFGGVDDTYATGTVSGVSQVGGLIGSHDANGILERSYATGAVTAKSQVGGLVGYNDNEIEDSYATGAVSGSSGKGALVGVNDYGLIANSYATGKGAYGFVGVNNGSDGLSNDYYDEGTTNTTIGVGAGSSAGVTAIGGSTGLDPHQQSSYAGFDFTNTWILRPGSSRPYLIDNPQSPPPT